MYSSRTRKRYRACESGHSKACESGHSNASKIICYTTLGIVSKNAEAIFEEKSYDSSSSPT